jgi:ATP-dependent RNA helicase DDX27
VINYEAPQSHEIYLHRVGRTARAGRTGRACTIAAEPDRKVVKAAVKMAKAQGAKIASRTIEAADLEKWVKKLANLEDEVEAVLQEEKEERAMQITERDLKRGENLMKYEDEIKGRPKRTWFESAKDKKAAQQASIRVLNGDSSAAKKKEKGKLSNKKKKQLQDRDDRREGKIWKKGKSSGKVSNAGASKTKKAADARKRKARRS